MSGLHLERTSFVKDKLLEGFLSTKNIIDKADCFFRNIHVYKEEGFDIAKRGILLYGPAGTGKSASLSVVCEKYVADEKTAVVFWPTDKFEAWKIKDFIKTFKYINGVEKLILIVEDIGGVEIDQVKMKSDSSLLALLDNQEKTFIIPVLIIATTNFPEVFLGNLTNRPNRFDDKIEVGYPSSEYRLKLMEFFNKNKELSPEVIKLMQSDKTKEFTASHIRECLIRSRIHEKELSVAIKEISDEIELYKKAFTKGKGISFDD